MKSTKNLKNLLVAALAVAALYGTPGFAADIPVKAPAYAPLPAYNWTGFYVGGHAGYARGDTDWTFLNAIFFNFAAGDQLNINDRSWLAGAHIGFNYQINSFVVGLEGTWSATGLKETVISPFFPDDDRETAKIKNLYTIAARAGVAFNQFLIYGKGGWAGGQVELSADSIIGVFWNPGKENHSGWVAGLGLEYMLTPNFILGVEYNRIDLGSETFSANNTGNSILLTEVSADTKVDSVVGRLSYKFGGF